MLGDSNIIKNYLNLQLEPYFTKKKLKFMYEAKQKAWDSIDSTHNMMQWMLSEMTIFCAI